MIAEGAVRIGGRRAGRRGSKGVFETSFALARCRCEPRQTLVRAPRQTRTRAHPVEDRAAHAEARVAAKRHTSRRIELSRGIEEPFATVALQLLQIGARPYLARDAA